MTPTTDKPGPQGDYAYVVSVRPPINGSDPGSGWWNHGQGSYAPGGPYNTTDWIDNLVNIGSPFQVVPAQGNWVNGSYSPPLTFASVSDGLSNQLFIGEKHIPMGRVGVCNRLTNSSSEPNSGDCSYLMTGVWKSPSSGRNISSDADKNGDPPYAPLQFPIARADDFQRDEFNPIRHYGFGSYHPGVCPFLLGDGSVRALPVTTQFSVLEALSIMDDGISVSLP